MSVDASDAAGAVGSADDNARDGWSLYSDEQRTRVQQVRAGWKALVIALFLGAMIWLSFWSTRGSGADISQQASFIVFAVVAGSLAAFAYGPLILERLDGRAAVITGLGRFFYVLAMPVIGIDKVLRGPVATFVGLKIKPWAPRYALLIAHVGFAAALVWLVPRYWPAGGWLGYVGLAWALVALVTVVRKWTWIENQFEKKAGGFDAGDVSDFPQLRDEALTAVLIFFLLVPVILWKVGGSLGLFEAAPGVEAAPWDWIALFGAELMKAIPLVDWAEVYDVDAATTLEPVRPWGLFMVFATRVVVDLVLIGALVYAVERVGSISRQWQEFLAGRRRLLDPSLEHRVFRVLRRKTDDADWFKPEPAADLGPFVRYDGGRLRALMREEDDPVHAAIVLHTAYAQDQANLFTPMAREICKVDGRIRENRVPLLELATALLGRAGGEPGRAVLEEVLSGFAGQPADLNTQVRSKAAEALAYEWRQDADSHRQAMGASDVVERLRRGLERNRERNGSTRNTIASQLAAIGGEPALATLAHHLEHEGASTTIAPVAHHMRGLASPSMAAVLLRDAAARALRCMEKLQSRPKLSNADRTAIEALSRAAAALEQAATSETKEGGS